MTQAAASTPSPPEPGKPPHTAAVATGLVCLEMVCRVRKVPIDVRRLVREHGLDGGELSPEEILRLARRNGFKCRLKQRLSAQQVVQHYPLPVIHCLPNGTYEVVLKSQDQTALVFSPVEGRTQEKPLTAFSDRWLVLVPKKGRGELPFGFQWFFREFAHYRLVMAEVLLGSFFVQVFGLLTPLFTQVILDKVIVHQALSTLDVLGVAFVGIAVFELLLNLARQYIFTHTASKLDVKLGAKLFHHLFSLSFAYFETRKVGDTLARVRELETLRAFLTQKSVGVVIDLLFSTLFLLVMFLYSAWLSWLVVGFVALMALLYGSMTPIFRQRLEAKFQMGAQSNAYLVEALTGVQTVKALAIEGQMQRQWEDRLGEYVTAGFELSQMQQVTNAAAALFQRLMTLAILYFGVRLVLDGQLTVGQLIAFNLFAAQFTAPILRLVNLWHEVQQVLLGVDRVGDILNQPTEVQSSKGITLPRLKGDIVFRQVSFRYGPSTPLVLNQVSFHIQPGQCVGIVGRSGSGKSTITKLIQKLYLTTEGMILLDGVDSRQLNPQWLRHHIGVVLQDNYLFSGTVAENIAMARPDAPMEAILEAARLAGAHEFITDMPEGYDTLVGERGASLSGGQRQRLAIARALITNPRILIFDEATSALDVESEQIIRRNLAKIQRGRTVLLIAHRLSTVAHCDLLLVLDKGQVVEVGTPQELRQRENGLYAHLCRQQEEDDEA